MVNALSPMNICQVFPLAFVLFLAMATSVEPSNRRNALSCGDIHNISFPFRLKSNPKGWGVNIYDLTCEDNRTVWYFYDSRFYVQFINYTTSQMRLVDDRLQKGNCSSLPRNSVLSYIFNTMHNGGKLFIMNCSKPVSSPFYITSGPCIEGSYSSRSNTSSNWNLYALLNPKASDVRDFCTISRLTRTDHFAAGQRINSSSYNYELIHSIMADGFVFNYFLPSQWEKTFVCYFDFYEYFHLRKIYRFIRSDDMSMFNGGQVCGSKYWGALFCAAKFVVGAPLVAVFLIYKYRRRHLAMDKNVEEFLQAHNNFLPIRYSYSNIKKITKNFKHKLGEGGYGSVYKGTLKSGNEVAIKVLKHSKAHGQDFISEVSTIGRIRHVNIVHLIGFCFEGSKQALVYDFMPNGSLDKHIFTEDGDKFLDCEKINEIALGVAKGIEYLHQGCDMQILHFDIKPHNILLDKNFTPKVSDFGLAKLYPVDHNIVSMTTARGTLGYMAPELFYKSIGGVSYKADVYSFGMMLMEMAGRRKNINANAERSSQIYFPLWVYDQVSEGESVDMEGVIEEERQVIKKMIIVALWCIQLIPDHRPPMNKVLDMLEGDIGNIQMPPKPLIYPPDEPVDNDKAEMELETLATSSSTPTISVSFPFGDSNDG